MNVTISLEEELVKTVREIARRRDTTLNELIRSYLEQIAGKLPVETQLAELQALWEQYPGRSGGVKIKRDDAYQGRCAL